MKCQIEYYTNNIIEFPKSLKTDSVSIIERFWVLLASVHQQIRDFSNYPLFSVYLAVFGSRQTCEFYR